MPSPSASIGAKAITTTLLNDGKEDELDDVALGVRYALGPGIDLAAFVGWFNYNDGGPTNNDNEGWQAGVGTGINF